MPDPALPPLSSAYRASQVQNVIQSSPIWRRVTIAGDAMIPTSSVYNGAGAARGVLLASEGNLGLVDVTGELLVFTAGELAPGMLHPLVFQAIDAATTDLASVVVLF